jgi:hypothetical protein
MFLVESLSFIVEETLQKDGLLTSDLDHIYRYSRELYCLCDLRELM